MKRQNDNDKLAHIHTDTYKRFFLLNRQIENEDLKEAEKKREHVYKRKSKQKARWKRMPVKPFTKSHTHTHTHTHTHYSSLLC